MLDLIPSEASIIACLADVATLDGWTGGRDPAPARVAPDELWLIGPRSERQAIVAKARDWLGGRGLVVDQTDGWVGWTLEGDARLDVVRRVMFAAVPDHRPAFVQGAISGVPGKVLYESNRVHLFVPAPVGHHLIDRLRAVGAGR